MVAYNPDASPFVVPAWRSTAEIGRVMVATPAYGAAVSAGYVDCLLATAALLRDRGVTWYWATTTDSLIKRARNRLTAQFLADPLATHIFFIDADILWSPRDVLRLLGHDKDVIAGAYRKKTSESDFAFHPLLDDHNQMTTEGRTGAVEIMHAATGFLCIKRSVFETMMGAKVPWVPPPWAPQAEGVMRPLVERIEQCPDVPDEVLPWLYDFFPCPIEDGIEWSEDYAFCKRWRQIGGRVWLDPAVKLGHVGLTTFEGGFRTERPKREAA